MGETIGALLDRLQTLLGKGYLLVGLFPLLVGILFSAPLAWAIEPEAPYWLQEFLEIPAARQAVYLAALLFLVCFLAFLLWTMNSSFRSLLEGRWLTIGRKAQINAYLNLEEKLRQLRPRVVDLRGDGEAWIRKLGLARNRARKRQTSGAAVDPATRAAYKTAKTARQKGDELTAEQLRDLYKRLRIEFRTNTAEDVDELQRIHDEFPDLIKYGKGRAEGDLNKTTEERLTHFPSSAGMIESTDLANNALANADQMYQRYGMNIELFWPLLEKFVRADEKMNAWLEEAKLRLDFWVTITVVWGVYTALWLPVLLWRRSEWWLFLAVSILGPASALASYRMCVRSTQGLYATMRAAAELYRFDLLKALHCSLPTDTADERKTWSDLTRLAELGEGSITYQHPQ
ncbi:MAG: hypothetical protein ACJ76Y_30330 [Thermoanaerobaculia bacterium]